MIKIYAGHEYHLNVNGCERVTRHWGRRQGGEYAKIEKVCRDTFLRTLSIIDDLTARLTCADIAGDYCLINKTDISQLERAM